MVVHCSCDDLPLPADKLGEVASLQFRQGPGRRPHAFGKEGDHLSVERAGFDRTAHSHNEIADLARVDDAEWQADDYQRGSRTHLGSASRSQDDDDKR